MSRILNKEKREFLINLSIWIGITFIVIIGACMHLCSYITSSFTNKSRYIIKKRRRGI